MEHVDERPDFKKSFYNIHNIDTEFSLPFRTHDTQSSLVSYIRALIISQETSSSIVIMRLGHATRTICLFIFPQKCIRVVMLQMQNGTLVLSKIDLQGKLTAQLPREIKLKLRKKKKKRFIT